MNSITLKFQRSRKIFLVGLLFFGQVANASDDDFWASGETDFSSNEDDLKDFANFYTGPMGNADTLIKALGENPVYYNEIGSSGIAWRPSNYISAGLNSINIFATTKSAKEINHDRFEKMKHAVDEYRAAAKITESDPDKALNNANIEFTKDAKALEDKLLKSKSALIKPQLEELMKIANMGRFYFRQELIKRQAANKIVEFKPTTGGKSLQEALREAQLNLDQPNLNAVTKGAYQAVVNHLQSIQAEIDKLKIIHSNSVDKALQAARNISALSTSNKTKQALYTEVIKQLESEQKAEKELFTKEESIKTAAQIIIDSMLARYDHPEEAFDNAQKELLKLEEALKVSEKKHDPIKTIEEQHHKIKIQHEVVKKLKEQADDANQADLEMNKRIRTLLKDNNDDLMDALQAAQDKVTANRGRVVKLDNNVVAELQRRIKLEENKQVKYETENSAVAKYVHDTYGNINNPLEALEKAEEALQKLYLQLNKLQQAGVQKNHQDIKVTQNKINLEVKAVDQLAIKAKEFESRVNKKLKDLLDKNNQDKQKSLNEILNSSYFSRFFTWNSAQSQADKIASMPEDTEENRVLKVVAKRLEADLKVIAAHDPYAVAVAKLHAASNPVEVTAALYGMIDATLIRVGSKVRIATLPEAKRREIAAILSVVQVKLLAIMQEPISDMAKQEKKQIVVKEMLDNISRILAVDFTGVSYEALKTGDARTIGMDYALNKLIDTLVPTVPTIDINNLNFDINAEKSPYEILGVQPGASELEIKTAYKQLALRHHPDRGGRAEDFTKISNAYQDLIGSMAPAA